MSADRSHLGRRFTCFSCACKFYDLGRPEALCPKCGKDQIDDPAPDPRVAAMAASKAAAKKAKAEAAVVPEAKEAKAKEAKAKKATEELAEPDQESDEFEGDEIEVEPMEDDAGPEPEA
jgi:uncharacterized protein (TIGR02300 family)